MNRHARRETIFGSFASSALHPLARTTIVLLTLVQIIAPMWHVCALGGNTCHDAHAAQAQVWKPKCGGGPICPCEPPADALFSPTGQWLSAPVDDTFHGTCLARLLLGMPSSVAAPFHFAVSFSQRSRFAPSPVVCPTVAALPQPPSRGPPLFCV